MNNITRFAFVLFLVNLIAASVLTGVYYLTRPRIEAQQKLIKEEALRQVMPGSVGNRLEPFKENGEVRYWKVFKGSDPIPRGYVFIAKKYGYSSIIESMVGMKKDGTITGVRVLSQNETPGLGARVVEVLSNKTLITALKDIFLRKKPAEKRLSPYFTGQFKGMKIQRMDISNIDAITGATISSKAVVDSIKSRGLEILGK